MEITGWRDHSGPGPGGREKQWVHHEQKWFQKWHISGYILVTIEGLCCNYPSVWNILSTYDFTLLKQASEVCIPGSVINYRVPTMLQYQSWQFFSKNAKLNGFV